MIDVARCIPHLGNPIVKGMRMTRQKECVVGSVCILSINLVSRLSERLLYNYRLSFRAVIRLSESQPAVELTIWKSRGRTESRPGLAENYWPDSFVFQIRRCCLVFCFPDSNPRQLLGRIETLPLDQTGTPYHAGTNSIL